MMLLFQCCGSSFENDFAASGTFLLALNWQQCSCRMHDPFASAFDPQGSRTVQWASADIEWSAGLAGSVEHDPKRSCALAKIQSDRGVLVPHDESQAEVGRGAGRGCAAPHLGD